MCIHNNLRIDSFFVFGFFLIQTIVSKPTEDNYLQMEINILTDHMGL